MNRHYRRNPNATERPMGRQTFLANPDYGTVYRANETVAALWRLLAEPTPHDEVVSVFQQAFPDTPRDRVAEELTEVLDDLYEEGLIEFDP